MSEPFISTICRVLKDVFSPGIVEIACDGAILCPPPTWLLTLIAARVMHPLQEPDCLIDAAKLSDHWRREYVQCYIHSNSPTHGLPVNGTLDICQALPHPLFLYPGTLNPKVHRCLAGQYFKVVGFLSVFRERRLPSSDILHT